MWSGPEVGPVGKGHCRDLGLAALPPSVSSWPPPDSSFAAPTIPTVTGTHLESQVMGCLGPHGWYTFAGGQVRSGGTEMGIR